MIGWLENVMGVGGAHHTVGEESLTPDPTSKLYKFYAIAGILLVIVPMMGLISFVFFIHGLTSDALLGNDNIETERKFIEINVHDTTKNVEILDHLVKQHLFSTENPGPCKISQLHDDCAASKVR